MKIAVFPSNEKFSQFVEAENNEAEDKWNEKKLNRDRTSIEKRVKPGSIDTNKHDEDGEELSEEELSIAFGVVPRRLLKERLDVSPRTE